MHFMVAHITYICSYKMSKSMFKLFFSFIVVVFISLTAGAQKIIYSQTDRDDQKAMSFDIIGKIKDHYLVYKSLRNEHNVTVYDSAMKTIVKTNLDFLPEKIINTDVLNYKDFFY